jgi:hypothetical protein
MVMERLKSRDHIAYVRFASVYRDFQDPEEFLQEFRDLADRQAQVELRRFQRELPLAGADEAKTEETAEETAEEGGAPTEGE